MALGPSPAPVPNVSSSPLPRVSLSPPPLLSCCGLLFAQRIRTQCLNVLYESGDYFSKSRSLRRGNPFHTEAFRIDPAVIERYPGYLVPHKSLLITFQVMAFTQVSTNHQNAVGSSLQCVDDEVGSHHTGAHHPDHPQVRGILQTTDPSQVSSSVCSPRAQESYDDRLEIFRHRSELLSNPFRELADFGRLGSLVYLKFPQEQHQPER